MQRLFCVTFVLAGAALLGLMVAAAAQSQHGAPPVAPHPQLDAWNRSRSAALIDDYGQLARYRAANQALAAPSASEQRVVFFGDSITDGWDLTKYFPGSNFINRGISGQTTSQMLLRFRQDVLDLQPKVIVILAGTNDIAGNTGPIALADIEANLATMAELARFHHIPAILASVTPVNGDVPGKRELFETRPPDKILALNAWMKEYCAANAHFYLDYFTAMVDTRGLMRPGLSSDGLHPNDAGYTVMTPLVETAIAKALQM